jgi:hypothetical protein
MTITLNGTTGITTPSDVTITSSGGGNFVIQPPNSATDRTLTLPDSAGTVDTLQRAGNVLQVVSFNTSSQGSVSVSSSDVALSPDITKSITPIGNNSNFLIQVRWAGEVTWGGQWNSLFNIHRDGSRINAPGTNQWQGLASPGLLYYSSDDSSTGDQMSLSTLDTTGSTAGTAITYRLVVCSSNTGTYTFYTNRTFGSTGQSGFETWSTEIIISEIKA